MREILFRGKRIDNGEWVYGYLQQEDKINLYYVKKETIGQFTGLLDKNGNKIFEGDILLCKKATAPEEKGFECVFRDNAFRFINRNHPNKEHFNIQIDEYDYIKEQLEIIGNIHNVK